MPLGPWITTASDVDDLTDLTIERELNGQVLQHASTSKMALALATIIVELSHGMTCAPAT